MGALLSLRSSNAPDPAANIFVDFENAQPTPSEATAFQKATHLLSKTKNSLDDLGQYKGCGELIRKAISSPSKETEGAAWESLKPAVLKLKDLYEYSFVVSEAFMCLLEEICSDSPLKNLESKQALARLLAQILDYALSFDNLKMCNPNIQNDFSFYRRSMAKMKNANQNGGQEVIVKEDMANKMSLFYATPTPLMKSIIESTLKFMKNHPEASKNVTECFYVMSSVCLNAVQKNRISDNALVAFCLRVMVASIVLFDHLDEQGAFMKDSQINIKSTVKAIEGNGGEYKSNLLNALRYNSKHFNDETTPRSVKNLLENS